MSFDFAHFAFDMGMFGAGLAIGAFVAVNWKPQPRVIPAELLPVDVVCKPEPRRLAAVGSSPSRVSEYAPRPKLARARFERLVASRHSPGKVVPEAAAPPPQPPQHDEVAARAVLPSINWSDR